MEREQHGRDEAEQRARCDAYYSTVEKDGPVDMEDIRQYDYNDIGRIDFDFDNYNAG